MTTTKSLVLLAHGFTGKQIDTWGDFPSLLREDDALRNFDIHCWEYPTSLGMSYFLSKLQGHFRRNDPAISTLGQGLRTELDYYAEGYDRIVLVGHSMGGLVIQSFIIEEILRGRTEHLDRLTDVLLYGTPSGGLVKARMASFLKNQIADMSDYGPFIQNLRSEWKRWVDEQRDDEGSPARFQLTLVAGLEDSFVPRDKVLGPFDYALKNEIPGDHSTLVKPTSREDLSYVILKKRLTHGSLTRHERELINGESAEVIEGISRVEAAEDLYDVKDLLDFASDLLSTEPKLPLVERKLGLATLDHEKYKVAAELLERFIGFDMPDGSGQPFSEDEEAVQHLAIALSGHGDISGATKQLIMLRERLGSSTETLGILAGRFKRQWKKSSENSSVGWRALQLYTEAFDSATKKEDWNQAFYNGVNAAYLDFMLGGSDYETLAEQVLRACEERQPPDYWCLASKGESHILLRDYPRAVEAFRNAFKQAPKPREVTSTGQQVLDMLEHQGNPKGANELRDLFGSVTRDY